MNYADMNLPQALKNALAAMNFTTPTPIQEQTIPPAMEGRDVLGTAMTGSGKTGAFCIPMIARLQGSPRGSALVLTPTRELAQQVEKVVKELLGPYGNIKSALLIGGESMPNQIAQLRMRPRIIVGTPGRIIDHLQRGTLMLHDASFLVLDETDRMLDMGFGDQIASILKYVPMQRQTLLFSATLPPQIQKIADSHLKNPVRVEIGETNKAALTITQETRHVSPEDKYPTLLNELKAREGTVIIFVRAKFGTEKLAAKLRKSGHTADAIHGDLEQRKREKVLQAFREKKHRILVATDIASRGLDIPHIEHVINFDLPQAPEDYIHRIGRTGRAGAEGSAVSFITPEDHLKWNAIQKLMDPSYKPAPGTPAEEAAKSANKNRKRGGRNRRGGSRSGGGNGGQGGQGGGQGRVVSKPSNGGGSPVQGLPRAI
ncbi:MAG: ATP-dependent RNA helicase [Azospirillum brasilense]|nr:MAG: ATP-dependent RNA helicase [Azospirillum brasilense]